MKNYREILRVGFWSNIIILIFIIFVIFGGIFIKSEAFHSFVFGSVFSFIKMICGYILFGYTIYLMRLWYKYDKHPGRFLGLFFLIGWYSIYYSHWLLKNDDKIDLSV